MEWITVATGKPESKPAHLKNKLFYNSLTGTLLYILNIVIMFIMSPVIIRTLGNRDYGLWEMVMAVVGYMGLLDLGIGPALLRYVAVAHSKDDQKELQEIISTAQIFFIAIGLTAALGLLVLSRYPALIAGKESFDSYCMGTVFILFALNAGISFPLSVFTAVLMGVQRHYLINATRGALGIIRSIIAYILLTKFAGKGLLILAILEPTFNLVQFGVFTVSIRRDRSIPGFSLAACSRTKLKELFGYGSKSAILMVSSRIQSTSIPFVISAVLGVSNIVYFTMPSRLVDYAKGLSLAMGFPLTPYFASQMAGDDRATVRTSWLQTTLAFQIITMAMPLVILFCGERFLTIWLGKEYGVAGRGVLYCLIAALFVESVAPNASKILLASGHHGRAALLWLGLAIVSIPVAVFGAYKWGVTGVALGSSIALIVGNIVMLKMACADVGISFVEYFNQTVRRLLFPLVILFFCLWVGESIFVADNYLNLALQVSLSSIIYLTAVWLLSLSQENKSRITAKVTTLCRGSETKG